MPNRQIMSFFEILPIKPAFFSFCHFVPFSFTILRERLLQRLFIGDKKSNIKGNCMQSDIEIKRAVRSFWATKKKQGSVLAGKHEDAFLELLKKAAISCNVPKECIFLKNNHIPGYFRVTKNWDFLIVSPKNNLIAAIELKSQVGSYGNNLNNRAEESLGSSVDFWEAYRTRSFPAKHSPWLGYVMIVGQDEKSEKIVQVYEPHFEVRTEFKTASCLDRYRILAQRLVLERKYSAVGLVATRGPNSYENLSKDTSLESFIRKFKGHLIGVSDEFE